MFKHLFSALLLGAVSIVCVQARAANLIVNSGFETGNFNGYTSTQAASQSLYGVENNFAHTGSNAAYFGSPNTSSYDMISQTLATTAGATESISFWFASSAAAPDFQALWDGSVIFDYTGQASIPLNTFVNISSTKVGTGSDTLTFRGYNVPGFDYLDDVSVNQSVAVTPEPSSLVLLGTGVLGVAGTLRRRLFA